VSGARIGSCALGSALRGDGRHNLSNWAEAFVVGNWGESLVDRFAILVVVESDREARGIVARYDSLLHAHTQRNRDKLFGIIACAICRDGRDADHFVAWAQDRAGGAG